MFADVDWIQQLRTVLAGAVIAAMLGLMAYLSRNSQDDKKEAEPGAPENTQKHARGSTVKTTSRLPLLLTILAILGAIALIVNLR
jgi:hypothetical protein